MIIQVIEAGLAATNGYLVADHENGVGCVIDAPEGVAAPLCEQAERLGLAVKLLLNTHGHWDHIVDNAALKRATGASFGIHQDSEPLLSIPQTHLFGLDLQIEPVTVDFYLAAGEPFRQMMAAMSHAIDGLGHEDAFQVVKFSNEAAVLGAGPVRASRMRDPCP